MTYIVALTGGVASGKTTVSRLFESLNVPVIDADVIAKKAVSKNSPALIKIARYFGDDILLESKELNRQKLRQIIFNDDSKRLWLNNLLHPLINEMTKKAFEEQSSPYVIWAVPLLFENNLQKQADRILVIDADEHTQLIRLIARDNISKELAKNILKSQISRDERLKCADDIIYNNENADLSQQVYKLHHAYLLQASQKINSPINL